jgi:hypothetical protein
MAKRSRRKEKLSAPGSDYTDAEGNVITMRGSLSPASRVQYARALSGEGRPAAALEDSWHRAVEFLFERLAVRWVIAGVPIERQRDLLARLRMASSEERGWIREVLREHCAEHFPDVRAP